MSLDRGDVELATIGERSGRTVPGRHYRAPIGTSSATSSATARDLPSASSIDLHYRIGSLPSWCSNLGHISIYNRPSLIVVAYIEHPVVDHLAFGRQGKFPAHRRDQQTTKREWGGARLEAALVFGRRRMTKYDHPLLVVLTDHTGSRY